MRTAGIFEIKQNFSAIVEAVEAGEEVRVTRHGKEVARIVPVPASRRVPTTKRTAEHVLRELREFRAGVQPGPGWKELRDEGRKY